MSLYVVSSDQDAMRLDRFVQACAPWASYSMVQKWIRKGTIRIDGRRSQPSDLVHEGNHIHIPGRPLDLSKKIPSLTAIQRQDWKSWIIEDSPDICVLNKPYGIPCQGGTHQSISLDRMAQAYYGESAHPRLVHRLDKNTTGVLLLAKNRLTAQWISDAFRHGNIKKTYYAIVEGRFSSPSGTIDQPLKKGHGSLKEKMIIDQGGDHAVTHYRVLGTWESYTIVELFPETGRTHQIRAHCAYMGHPVWGDRKYGNPHIHEDIPMHLHGRRLSLMDPHGEERTFEAPLPNFWPFDRDF